MIEAILKLITLNTFALKEENIFETSKEKNQLKILFGQYSKTLLFFK